MLLQDRPTRPALPDRCASSVWRTYVRTWMYVEDGALSVQLLVAVAGKQEGGIAECHRLVGGGGIIRHLTTSFDILAPHLKYLTITSFIKFDVALLCFGAHLLELRAEHMPLREELVLKIKRCPCLEVLEATADHNSTVAIAVLLECSSQLRELLLFAEGLSNAVLVYCSPLQSSPASSCLACMNWALAYLPTLLSAGRTLVCKPEASNTPHRQASLL